MKQKFSRRVDANSSKHPKSSQLAYARADEFMPQASVQAVATLSAILPVLVDAGAEKEDWLQAKIEELSGIAAYFSLLEPHEWYLVMSRVPELMQGLMQIYKDQKAEVEASLREAPPD